MLKKGIVMITIILLITQSFGSSVIAQNSSSDFTDVGEEHWAYESIKLLVERNVLSGYGDGTFKPNKSVNRGEFAKMMVLALDLSLNRPDNQTFEDISKNHWAYSYVETAKYYLTGFRTSSGDYFRPDNEAVREDMAVALVKALGYYEEDVDVDVLNQFSDKGKISDNLRKAVAIAVKKGLMQGYGDTGLFKPQNTLTRAEAAVLLARIINQDEEKVIYDEEETKIIYEEDEEEPEDYEEDTTSSRPILKANTVDGQLKLSWNVVSDGDFKYYKVVVSKNNPNPKYPEDGYLCYISNRYETTKFISPGAKYHNGDFNGTLKAGETYYFSITAVYGDKKIAGNSLRLKVPH